MTTLVPAAISSAEAAESSTARTTHLVAPAAAAAATAEVIAAPPQVVSTTASILPLASDTTEEIVAISQQIRRALECPICLTLMSAVMSCDCPNGHATCRPCMMTLMSINPTADSLCPLCRTLMMQFDGPTAMVVKLTEVTSLVKVACFNRSLGCPELLSVRWVNEHEAVCRYVADVPCQVAVCQWVGTCEQLYDHVSSVHPGVAVESSTNRLKVTDLHAIPKNRRRTYLVRSTYGLIWVLLSRAVRSRIQVGLFMVNKPLSGRHPTPAPGRNHANPQSPDILYRVTWFDNNDRSKTKSRTKEINWSTTLKEGCHTTSHKAYSMFRSRTGSMEISWFPFLRHNNYRQTNPST
ncbi:uncharacterized protein LOC111028095 [Myzus persicae]|uniref:uncharacterized protein LOC111028095 n=1 Tax=Myzus persicae TaxID=13164 RepID=UPI000B930380|nr:uncharacterized protein LOC111028095 [Myzus persicae]